MASSRSTRLMPWLMPPAAKVRADGCKARNKGWQVSGCRICCRGHRYSMSRQPVPPMLTISPTDPRMSAYVAWLKQHRGASDGTIRRYRAEIELLKPMLGEPSQWDAASLRRA